MNGFVEIPHCDENEAFNKVIIVIKIHRCDENSSISLKFNSVMTIYCCANRKIDSSL